MFSSRIVCLRCSGTSSPQSNRPDSGNEDMWNPESPSHASTSGDFVFELMANQPIALLPPSTNDERQCSWTSGKRRLFARAVTRERGQSLPLLFRACVRCGSGPTLAISRHVQAASAAGSSRYAQAPCMTANEREIFATVNACTRQSIVGSLFLALFPRCVGGKRRGAFLAFSCQVGQHCILRVIKVPCKSPETARLAMFHHPCALAGCCDDNQAAL